MVSLRPLSLLPLPVLPSQHPFRQAVSIDRGGVREAWRLASRVSRRHPLVPLLGVVLLAALLALVLPLAESDGGPARRDADSFGAGAATALASEDLALFRTNARWGVSLQGEREKAEAQERILQEELENGTEDADNGQAAWSPELQAIGFVGVVITASERVVLLALPADKIDRFHVGDVLEDGRRLASISAHELVLQHEDGQEETLALFPAASTAQASVANADNPPTEGE